MPLDSPFHHDEDTTMERCLLRSAIVRGMLVIGAAFLVIAMLLSSLGCASKDEKPWAMLCYEQPLGLAENGMLVVRHFCAKEGAQ